MTGIEDTKQNSSICRNLGRQEVTEFRARYPEIVWIDAMLPDIHGIPRGKRIHVEALDKLIEDGLALPSSVTICDVRGNSVLSTGVGTLDGAPDCLCRPVSGTLRPVSWLGRSMGQVMLSMTDGGSNPHPFDVREIVRRVECQLLEEGFTPVAAVELEFYLTEYLENAAVPSVARDGRGLTPSETQFLLLQELEDRQKILTEMVDACAAVGVVVTSVLSEGAPGQFEINIRHCADTVLASDQAFLIKRTIKGVARKHGLTATFMARPFAFAPGNGLHIHLSLLDQLGRNVFDDGRESGTEALRNVVGGMMATMREGTAIFAPNGNWFRRPHTWWPPTLTWGFDNRRAALRVPQSRGMDRRVEHRPSGADANPYLVLAAILAGAHHGLTHEVEPPAPRVGSDASTRGDALARHWNDALRDFDKSKILRGYFGDNIWTLYSSIKWEEYWDVNSQITNVEHSYYSEII